MPNSVNNHIPGPTISFLGYFTHARDQCSVTSQYVTVVTLMHTATRIAFYQKLRLVMFNVLGRVGLETDAQDTDVVTFDFKDSGVCCVVFGIIDYQINFVLFHNVAK